MIKGIIHWSIDNRFFVILLTLMLVALGVYSLRQTPGRCNS